MKRRDFAIGLGGAAMIGGLASARGVPPIPPVSAPFLPSTSPADWPTGPAKGNILAVAAKNWNQSLSGVASAMGRQDALVIIQDGRLIFERYGPDHGPTTRHISWSMAKSFTHALVGIATLEGRVNPDRPLTLVKNPNPKLTLRSLLTLTDGLKWDEAAYSVVDSDATKMLYGPGRLNGAAYMAAMPQAYPPGTHWRYSTGSFQLAAAELQAALFPGITEPDARRKAMADWIRSRLFVPLGMQTALAEFDASGGFYGGSLIYASARDYARFGELYRLDGVWNGKRILPEGWVKFAHTPTVEPAYGAGFWLETPHGSKIPGLTDGVGPMDVFCAEGHSGQVIMIAPSKGAVLVRLGLGDDVRSWKVIGQWMTPMLAAMPDVAKPGAV